MVSLCNGRRRLRAGTGLNEETIDMRKLILAGALAFLVLAPLPAAAQQKLVLEVPSSIEGVDTAKIVAVAIGAILGAAAAEAVIGGQVVAIVGGVTGGLIGAWWYDNGGSVRVTMREPHGAPALARAEHLALAK
jgi:hypothetical protein